MGRGELRKVILVERGVKYFFDGIHLVARIVIKAKHDVFTLEKCYKAGKKLCKNDVKGNNYLKYCLLLIF